MIMTGNAKRIVFDFGLVNARKVITNPTIAERAPERNRIPTHKKITVNFILLIRPVLNFFPHNNATEIIITTQALVVCMEKNVCERLKPKRISLI